MVNDFIFNESIDEIIKKRKSIRTYTNEEVSQEIIKNLNTYIKNLKSPFNESVTFEIIDSKEHINGSKIGTYGIIKGATKFIVVKVKKSEFSLQDLGYKMESLILYATSLGLGTCWIGGTFKKGQFAKLTNPILNILFTNSIFILKFFLFIFIVAFPFIK